MIRAQRALIVLSLVLLVTPPAWGAVRWDQVTGPAGIAFQTAGEVHAGNDPLWPAAPEIFGGGACWGELDGDGYPDLYLVNARFNPHSPATTGWIDAVDPRDALYLNNGDGTFSDATDASGIHGRSMGYGCSLADFDADGDVDVFVSGFDGNVLYRNEGDGTFSDVAAASGLAMTGACGAFACQSTSSAWADYDGDGDLDLYVGNYVDTTWTDGYRGPENHIAQLNFLHRNNGDGTFTEVAHATGVAGKRLDENGHKTLGVVWSDFDRDGHLDLYVANDLTRNNLYHNQGDGTFRDIGNASGTADPRTSMGVAAGDYDNDGYPDLFFTHYSAQTNGFYRNLGNLTFEDRSGEDGQNAGIQHVGWGAAFADYDLDQDQDILYNNGHTEWSADMGASAYSQPGQVIRNDPQPGAAGPGDRLWVDVTNQSGDWALEKVWRGLALADYDLDGDLDAVFVPNANQTAMLLRGSGVTNNGLRIELRQPGLNPSAIGAKLRVETADAVQHLEVQAGSSYLSQNDIALLVGLGANTMADRIVVTWPDGGATTLVDVAAGQAIRIERALGGYVVDTLAPRTRLEGTPPSATAWWNAPVDIRLVAQDRAVTTPSGVAGTTYRMPGGTWAAYDGALLPFSAAGVHVIEARSTDQAGNVEPLRRLAVGLDYDDPVPRHDFNGVMGAADWWIGSHVDITLWMEDALSGPGPIRYRIDGGPWTAYNGTVRFAQPGAHTFEYEVQDKAGNAVQTGFALNLDTTAPNITGSTPRAGGLYVDGAEVASTGFGHALVGTSPAAPGKFRLTAQAEDVGSGVAHMALLLDGELLAESDGPFVEAAWSVDAAQTGKHRLSIAARDAAGQPTIRHIDLVVVGAVAPGTALYPGAHWAAAAAQKGSL